MRELRSALSRAGAALAGGSVQLIELIQGYAVACVVLIGTIDLALRAGATSPVIREVLDGPAHLLTAALLLALVPKKLNPVLLTTALATSLLIDLDHLPVYLGWSALIAHAPRPYTHSLATVVVAGLLSFVVSSRLRPVFAGIAVGVLLHFVRDVTTAAVPLFWPVSTIPVEAPYAYYAVLLITTALLLVSRTGASRVWVRRPSGGVPTFSRRPVEE